MDQGTAKENEQESQLLPASQGGGGGDLSPEQHDLNCPRSESDTSKRHMEIPGDSWRKCTVSNVKLNGTNTINDLIDRPQRGPNFSSYS